MASDALQLWLNHLANKRRDKERRDDKAYDLYKLQISEEMADKTRADAVELTQKQTHLNRLEDKIKVSSQAHLAYKQKMIENQVDLDKLSDEFKSGRGQDEGKMGPGGPWKVQKDISEVRFDDYEGMMSVLLNNLNSINSEINVMQDVLVEDVSKVNNIISGGLDLTWEGGVGFGRDVTGWDIEDLGLPAYQEVYGDVEDDSIVADLFRQRSADVKTGLQAQEDIVTDLALKESKIDYYDFHSKQGISKKQTEKKIVYENDFMRAIKDARIDTRYNDQQQYSRILNDVDEVSKYSEEQITEMTEEEAQIQIDISKDFIDVVGLTGPYNDLQTTTDKANMVDEWWLNYQSMMDKANQVTQTSAGVVADHGFNDYYTYLMDAQEHYNSLDPGQKSVIDDKMRRVFGIPKDIEVANFFVIANAKWEVINATHLELTSKLAEDSGWVLKQQQKVLQEENKDIIEDFFD